MRGLARAATTKGAALEAARIITGLALFAFAHTREALRFYASPSLFNYANEPCTQ